MDLHAFKGFSLVCLFAFWLTIPYPLDKFHRHQGQVNHLTLSQKDLFLYLGIQNECFLRCYNLK